MAVLLEMVNVVVKRSAIERRQPGGLAEFLRDSPSGSTCADEHLCRVGFMTTEDAAAFASELETKGYVAQRGGLAEEIVMLHAGGSPQFECEWLVTGHRAGAEAAWLRGEDPEPLVVPFQRHSDPSLQHFTQGEADERLEYLGTKDGVETWGDRATGQLRYVARARSELDRSEEEAARLQARFEAASELVRPFLRLADSADPPRGWFARRRFRKGLAELEAVSEAAPDAWAVHWHLGMAYRAQGEGERACECFRRAHSLNPDQPDIAREYAAQCLALGRGEDAVRVSRRNCEQHPDDPGLRSNFALALLVAGRVDDARAEVRRALELEPGDLITRNLAEMIEDVRQGRREAPERIDV